mgnify:CR=1 FL=1
MSNGGNVELAEMDDASRAAAKANYKITKQQLIDIVECYRQRKDVEDLDYIQNKTGGMEGVLQGVDVDYEQGISASSLHQRLLAFGDHNKDPPERTGFWQLVWESLQDFML